MILRTDLRVLKDLSGPNDLTCACAEQPELHQPDPANDGALVGVCLACGRWTIFGQIDDQWHSALAVEIVAFESAPSDGIEPAQSITMIQRRRRPPAVAQAS